jgi:phosphatidylinositol alpha-mannosyltransferase
MKIGLVSDTCYPFPSGAAEYIYNLYGVLKGLGHDVKIITSSYGYRTLQDPDIIRIGKTVLFPFNKAMVTLTFGTNLVSEMKRVFYHEKFDIVHIQGPIAPTLPLLALICSDTAAVGIFASYYERSRLLGMFKPLINKYFYRLRGRVCISQAAKKAISRYFEDDYKIIPQGIDVQRFAECEETVAQFMDGKVNILFVGRMEERKGLKYLIEAYSKMVNRVKDVRLVVVGDGPEKQGCLRAAERAGGEIAFVGRAEFDQLPKFYRSSHIFCSPATGSEAQGIVLLEALASGTPVVASNIDGYNEVIADGRDGLLVPPKDPETLALTLTELCRNKELRDKLTAEGLKKAELYSWDRIGRALEQHYLQLLQ